MSGRIERRVEGTDTVVALIDEVDMADVHQLRDLLQDAAGGSGRVVVDMTETHFIDSTVMAALLLVQNNGTRIVLRGAHGEPRRALEIAGVLDIVDLED